MRARLPRRLTYRDETTTVGHLAELRARIVISLVALCAAFAFTWALRATIMDWLARPLPPGYRPATFGVTEPFMTSFSISVRAATVLALPILFWQAWSFLAPALEETTQRVMSGLALLAVVLAFAGVAFGYFVVMPPAIRFLTNFDTSLYAIQIRARDYYNFASICLLATAVVFEVPVFVLGLTRLRVVSTARLRRNRRTGYVVMAVVAVVLPGVDPVTTVLEMIPLMCLFECSIWLSVLFDRRAALASMPAAKAAAR